MNSATMNGLPVPGKSRVIDTSLRPPKSMHPRHGNHADFFNDRVNVDMILGICDLRWCADLPNATLSRSFVSTSFSDIAACARDGDRCRRRLNERLGQCRALINAVRMPASLWKRRNAAWPRNDAMGQRRGPRRVTPGSTLRLDIQ